MVRVVLFVIAVVLAAAMLVELYERIGSGWY